MITYHIMAESLGDHTLKVKINLPKHSSQSVKVELPKWIPGSYKIRDYSRFLYSLIATQQKQKLPITQLTTSSWLIETKGEPTTIAYYIHAYDLSVRGNYLDDRRLFINPCCTCLRIHSLENKKHIIELSIPNKWKMFSSIKESDNRFISENYNELIDSPIEASIDNAHISFNHHDIKHHLVFTGDIEANYDLESIADFTNAICKAQTKIFGDLPLKKDYFFLTYIERGIYGGLEHEHSTALMASPDMIPKKNTPLTESQIDFLALCSHEYFHLWNVKRMRPHEYLTYQLDNEHYTDMLWFFEGMTSYYDEKTLYYSNIIDESRYLKRLEKTINQVLNTPGRKIQTLSESSFNAWTKLYQADKNSKNIIISYYSKGALFALYLDLFMRYHTNCQASLDHVMQNLWHTYGKTNKGLKEKNVLKACQTYLKPKQQEEIITLFDQALRQTDDLDIFYLLALFGIKIHKETTKIGIKNITSEPHIRLKEEGNSLKIISLDYNSPASHLGLSIDDEIIAINGQKADKVLSEQTLFFSTKDEKVELTIMRRNRLFKKELPLKEPSKSQITLTIADKDKVSQWLKPC